MLQNNGHTREVTKSEAAFRQSQGLYLIKYFMQKETPTKVYFLYIQNSSFTVLLRSTTSGMCYEELLS